MLIQLEPNGRPTNEIWSDECQEKGFGNSAGRDVHSSAFISEAIHERAPRFVGRVAQEEREAVGHHGLMGGNRCILVALADRPKSQVSFAYVLSMPHREASRRR